MNKILLRFTFILIGLLPVMVIPTVSSADDYSKSELLFFIMAEKLMLLESYQCDMDIYMDMLKMAEMDESEDQARLIEMFKKTSSDMRLKVTTRYKHPSLIFSEFSGTSLQSNLSGKIYINRDDFKELITMPKGTMGFNMVIEEVAIPDAIMMMNNSQPGMKFGFGLVSHYLFGPKATVILLEHILKYYTSRFKKPAEIDGQEMLVVEFIRKEGLSPTDIRNLDLPVFPKLEFWISKKDMLVRKIEIFNEAGYPVISTRIKNYQLDKEIPDSVFSLTFPPGINVVDSTPLLNILKTMKQKQSQDLSFDGDNPKSAVRIVRHSPQVKLDTQFPELNLKPVSSPESSKFLVLKKEKPVFFVILSSNSFSTKMFLPELAATQKLAEEQGFQFITVLAEKDHAPLKEILQKMEIPLTVYFADEPGKLDSLKPNIFPSFYIFDKSHQLQWRDGGITAWADIIKLREANYQGIDLFKGLKNYKIFYTSLRDKITAEDYKFLLQTPKLKK